MPSRFSVLVAIALSRPSPEPSSVAPPGTGSFTTTHVMSDCASISSRTRITSPRDHLALSFCSTADTLRVMRVAGAIGAFSGTAARLCTVSHGLPPPTWVTLSVPGLSGHGSFSTPPFASLAQSSERRAALEGEALAVVVPAIFADSNFAENLSSASEPHRLAVVVDHAPLR